VDPARAPRTRASGQPVAALPPPPLFPPAPHRRTRTGTTRVVPASAEHAFDARLPEAPPLISEPVVVECPPPEPVIQVVTVPEPVYVPVPNVVGRERRVPEPEREPPTPPGPVARPRSPAPPSTPAPATPADLRSIRLRDPESGDARSRRR
jgi:hypothetical protein